MTVATERVFRSDETPKLKLDFAERRVGDGPGVQGRYGDVFPQDAPRPRRRRARHLADRSGQDLRVQGARSYVKHRRVGVRDRSAAARRSEDRRDGRHGKQQDARSDDAGDPERSRRDREKLARRGLRVRREHADRQALARGAAADLERPAGLRRRDDRRRRRVAEVVQGTERRRRRARVRRRRRQRGLERDRLAGRRRRRRARRQGIHLHRSARLSRRAGRAYPRLSAPRGQRRLHDREGQEVHARRARRRQPPACRAKRSSSASSARSIRIVVLPTTSRPGQYRVLAHDDAGPELLRRRSPFRSTAWSRFG